MDAKFFDSNRFFLWQQDCSCPITVTSGCLKLLPVKHNNIVRLNRIIRMAYAFCTSHFENSKCPVQILYPFGTGKPVPNQNRLSSSPMLSGSLTHATLLLPSEMFNSMPQSLGLEEHPQSAYFTGNVVCWKCSWLYETVDWLRYTLRLINLTLRSTPSIN